MADLLPQTFHPLGLGGQHLHQCLSLRAIQVRYEIRLVHFYIIGKFNMRTQDSHKGYDSKHAQKESIMSGSILYVDASAYNRAGVGNLMIQPINLSINKGL